ncbi:MAG: SUMF1/EgtB/PvdO family nonheme iron enzyme [Nitrospinota bacterium]
MDDIEGLVPSPEGENLPVAPERPEESIEWVIETYRKHQLNKVTMWLNENLGKGRRNKTLIPRVLLDTNPISHRQSLLEIVFPAPRHINEKLLDINSLKFMLDADSGMGKTTFLMRYLEELLDAPPHQIYSLPVYFHLGNVPEGGGFQSFIETVQDEIVSVILLEKEENPDLILEEDLLRGTLGSIFNQSKFMFLLDGFDQLHPQDRFRFFVDSFLEDNAFKSNFVLLASRKFEFGALATDAVVKRGEGAAFQMAFQPLSPEETSVYLGDASKNNIIKELAAYTPELTLTPILLKMIRSLSDNEKLEGLENRAEIYEQWFKQLVLNQSPEIEEGELEKGLGQLAEISFQQMLVGKIQRFQKEEPGYEKSVIDKNKFDLLIQEDEISARWKGIIQQTPRRWEFCHPSYQEYFAARHIAKMPEWENTVRENCGNEKWHEAFKILAGLVCGKDLFDVFIEEGAVMLAGNSLAEVKELPEGQNLLIRQLLKYQCNEALPQFKPCRLVRVQDVWKTNDEDYLQALLDRLLLREHRDSRILFSVFELVLFKNGLNLHDLLDNYDFAPIRKLECLQAFFNESKDGNQVTLSRIKKHGEMVTVPKGKFIYQEEEDEEDQIDMKEFAIMKFPVTNALYMQFDPQFKLRFPSYSWEEDQPVIGINYFESVIFSLWLGMRLPTEKEWEKAARGTDGRVYPWGEAMGYEKGFANTCDFMECKTSSVTEMEPGMSPYGCFDMAGNVWEWCMQWNASKHSTQRIVRGGSWMNYLVHAKCFFRNSFDPSERYLAVGLRCVSGPRFTEIEAED